MSEESIIHDRGRGPEIRDPPEVRAKYAASHARFIALKNELDRKKGTGHDARGVGR